MIDFLRANRTQIQWMIVSFCTSFGLVQTPYVHDPRLGPMWATGLYMAGTGALVGAAICLLFRQFLFFFELREANAKLARFEKNLEALMKEVEAATSTIPDEERR